MSAPETRPAVAEPSLVVRTLGGDQQLTVVPADAAEDDPALGVVAVLPALGVRAGYYGLLASQLAARGLHTVLVDLPGHGESPLRSSRKTDWGYRELVEDHLPAVRTAIRESFSDTPFLWLGHSLGGQLALIDAGRFPEEVDRVILVASGVPYFRAWPPVGALALLTASSLAVLLARLWGHFPGERVGFAGREARSLMRDWGRIVRSGDYGFTGLDGEAALASCTQPILAVTLANDTFATQRSVDHALEKTASTRISRWTWASEEGPIDHNRWPRAPEAVVDKITEWLAGGSA